MREKVVIGIYAGNTERVASKAPLLVAAIPFDADVDELMRDRGWKRRILEACSKQLAGKRVMSVNAIRTGPDGCNVAVTIAPAPKMPEQATRRTTNINGKPIAKPTAPTPASLRRQGRRG